MDAVERYTDAVRAYFDQLNQFWLTADTEQLAKAAGCSPGDPLVKRWLLRLRRKQRELSKRSRRLLRTHTKLTMVQMDPCSGDAVNITVDEYVTWVYSDGADYGVESRVVRHWQSWRLQAGTWCLLDDHTSEEQSTRTAEAALMLEGHEQWGGVWADGLRAPCHAYDRLRAQRYAELWWDGYNPAFVKFMDDDCTNFVSQCLLAGSLRMTGGQSRASGWWYRSGDHAGQGNWSFSWAVANALYQYLTGRAGAQLLDDPRSLKIGDLILYDWDGGGRYGHSAMVVDFDRSGAPLVNAHTEPSYHRHYQYLDSPAWTQQTRYAYVHLPDDLC